MTDLDTATDFIWRNARLLDRHRFAHLFLGAGAEPVVTALRAYRNPDGGFGNALEPDLRGTASQPAAVQSALELLAEANAHGDPMIEPAADFLASITRPDSGIPFVLPTVREHPRAPWWEPADKTSLTQTAANAAALLRLGSQHSWLEGASAYCWARIEALDFLDDSYDTRYAVVFLDAVPDAARAGAALDSLRGRTGLEALDVSPWPDSRSRRLFDRDEVDAGLEKLAAGQSEDGGWTFDFPAWAPAQELDWRVVSTIQALAVLRAHGRL